MVDGFICPVEQPFRITQTYAEHMDYAKKHPELKYNGGIDLYSDYLLILAAFPGRVDKIAYEENGYGNYVKLKHAWGYTIYGHMNSIYVQVGKEINAGIALGLMGSTGFSTGRHLHFEMRDLKEKVLDPTEYFEQTEAPKDLSGLPVICIAPAGGNLRRQPMGDLIMTVPNGTEGKIISGPEIRLGHSCYQVEFPVTGWMAREDAFGTKILEVYGLARKD